MNIKDFFSKFFKNKATTEVDKLLSALKKINKDKLSQSRVFNSEKSILDWRSALDRAIRKPYSKYDLYRLIVSSLTDAHLRAVTNTRLKGTLAEPFVLSTEVSTHAVKLIRQAISAILKSNLYWATAIEYDDESAQFEEIPALFIEPQEGLLIPNPPHGEGIELDTFKNLLLFKNPENDLGLYAYAIQYVLYKKFSVSDWSRHSELFGMPFLALRTPVTDRGELQKRHEALANFGRNAYVILEPDEELAAIDMKTTTKPHEIYLEMIRFCDEQISKLIVGQTSTSEQKAYVGAAEVHERILEWYVEDDMRYVETTINEKVLPFLEGKGIVPPRTVFEWEYFRSKAKGSPREQAAFFFDIKKKRLVVLKFDFEDFEKDKDEGRLFDYYLNTLQKPLKQLLNDEPKLKNNFFYNLFEFAAAKTIVFYKKLKKETNKQALFNKFQSQLETETATTSTSLQAALEWAELQKDKEQFPILEFRAVNDENTRPSHAALNGIRRPIDDVFWEKYYPPIDWRCRCSVRQHRAGTKISPLPKKLPELPAGLRHNPGISMKVFDETHPYFKNVNRYHKKTIKNYFVELEKGNKGLYFNPVRRGFVVAHPKAMESDLNDNLEAAEIMAKAGYEVLINEHKENSGKQPEFTINGLPGDLKTPKTKDDHNVFWRAFQSAAKQKVSYVVVKLTRQNYDPSKLAEGILRGFRNKKKIKKVIAFRGKDIVSIAREDSKKEILKKLYKLLK